MLDSMYRQAAVFLEYVQHFIAYERHSNLFFARPGLPETAWVKGVEAAPGMDGFSVLPGKVHRRLYFETLHMQI